MEQAKTALMMQTDPRVLAAGTSQGHRLELLEYSDGSVAILCDGAEQAAYRQTPSNLESGIKVYLSIMREGCFGAA